MSGGALFLTNSQLKFNTGGLIAYAVSVDVATTWTYAQVSGTLFYMNSDNGGTIVKTNPSGAIGFNTGSIGYISNCSFDSNQASIGLNSGQITVTNSSFFSSAITKSAITCYNTVPTYVSQSGNDFCGSPPNITCGSWGNTSPNLTSADGCDICGGIMNVTDCNGTCWGTHVYDTGSSPKQCCLVGEIDCMGMCNGAHRLDDFGICCLNSSYIDCLGHCNGSAIRDNSIPTAVSFFVSFISSVCFYIGLTISLVMLLS